MWVWWIIYTIMNLFTSKTIEQLIQGFKSSYKKLGTELSHSS